MTSPHPLSETIVTVAFQLKTPVDIDHFLDLSARLEAWLHGRPGFRRYALYRSDVGWSDTMTWSDREAARAGNAAFLKTDLAHDMVSLVEPGYRSFIGDRVSLGNMEVNA